MLARYSFHQSTGPTARAETILHIAVQAIGLSQFQLIFHDNLIKSTAYIWRWRSPVDGVAGPGGLIDMLSKQALSLHTTSASSSIFITMCYRSRRHVIKLPLACTREGLTYQ